MLGGYNWSLPLILVSKSLWDAARFSLLCTRGDATVPSCDLKQQLLAIDKNGKT